MLLKGSFVGVRRIGAVLAAGLLACGLAGATPAAAQTLAQTKVASSVKKTPLPEIAGTWKVTSVVVQPGPTPKNVLNPNDPIYVGAMLEISPAWMAWQPRKGGGSFGDVCMEPKLDGFTLKCSYGNFGPVGAKVGMFEGLLIVGWYDNVQLILQRVS
jgi:hypothetical protein